MSKCISGTTDAASSSHPPSSASLNPVQVERVEAENKRLLSLMEEKDRKIDLLEFKITQLMKDTRSVTEEQARLHKENTTLLRALSNITKQQEQDKMPPGK
jgi:predicted RNase H-like nuclease (RuvC/YqgF family)